MKWYMAKCPTGAEENAMKDLKNILTKMKAETNLGEYLVPYEKVGKRTVKSNVANYVFIQLNLTSEVKEAFNKAQLISLTLNENLEPITIEQEEIDKMNTTIQKRKDQAQIQEFSAGEIVKVLEAPFEDFTAVIEKVDEKKEMVSVSVPILGRRVSVELPFKSIQRITD